MNRKTRPLLLILILVMILSACQPGTKGTTAPAQTSQAAENALPPEPQIIHFTADDGQELIGTYYPAKTNPAPLIILMHWMRGSQKDWAAVAVWLQNRGMDSGIAKPLGTWEDGSWFPKLPNDFSVGVFTFTYRGCLDDKGCPSFDPIGWTLDTQVAVKTALTLPGVDQNRIITAGASIGASGAPIGCNYLNALRAQSCRGAFLLSPGDYLAPYKIIIDQGQSSGGGKPGINGFQMAVENKTPIIWCLADEKEIDVCNSVSGDFYKSIEIKGGGHGMIMLAPGLKPQAIELLIEFIKSTT